MDNLEKTNDTSVETTLESEFLTKNMTGLFWKYVLFAFAGLAFQAAGVVADGFFVGNGVGGIGLATVGIIVPLMVATIGIFLLFAIGASTLAGIKLGEGDVEAARSVYGSTMIFTTIFSIIIAVICLLAVDPILTGLGATPDILPFARQYAIPFFIGFPLSIVGQTAYSFTRLAEKPLAASLTLIIPCVIGAVFEYFAIFQWNLGMAGSSIFYVIGVGGTIVLIPYLQASDSVFKIRRSDLKINYGYIWQGVKIGLPMFLINIATIFSTVIINHQIIKYGGDELNIAAFGIMNAYIAYILTVFTNAFITGMQPVVSYNMGAKKYSRIKTVIKVGIVQSSLVIVLIMVIVFAFATPIVTFFTGPVPPLVDATIGAMKIFLILYALGNVAQIVSGYFIAVEKNGLAILNACARVIIFAIPLLYIMPNFFGLKGIWMAQPGADFLACILAVICIIREYRTLTAKEKDLTL